MARDPIFERGYKPQFSGHETFPLRYGWLKKVYDAVAEKSSDPNNKSVFLNDEAIARFGVGKNMVGSMRYWAMAANVIKDRSGIFKGPYVPTEFGERLFSSDGWDPYLEQSASLWWLHWQFAANPKPTTTIYYVFNHFHAGSFYRQQLQQELERYCDSIDHKEIAPYTLKRDVDCFLRTYVARPATSEEDSLYSLMAELALIQPISKQDGFLLSRGQKPSLPDQMFLYGLVSYAIRRPDRRTFSVDSLTHEAGSPGRVFLLNEDALLDRLTTIEELSEQRIVWSETAGIRQILFKEQYEEKDLLRIMERAYTKHRRRRAAA